MTPSGQTVVSLRNVGKTFESGTVALDGFSFDVEALYVARRRGLRIAELPVTWRKEVCSAANRMLDRSTVHACGPTCCKPRI